MYKQAVVWYNKINVESGAKHYSIRFNLLIMLGMKMTERKFYLLIIQIHLHQSITQPDIPNKWTVKIFSFSLEIIFYIWH